VLLPPLYQENPTTFRAERRLTHRNRSRSLLETPHTATCTPNQTGTHKTQSMLLRELMARGFHTASHCSQAAWRWTRPHRSYGMPARGTVRQNPCRVQLRPIPPNPQRRAMQACRPSVSPSRRSLAPRPQKMPTCCRGEPPPPDSSTPMHTQRPVAESCPDGSPTHLASALNECL